MTTKARRPRKPAAQPVLAMIVNPTVPEVVAPIVTAIPVDDPIETMAASLPREQKAVFLEAMHTFPALTGTRLARRDALRQYEQELWKEWRAAKADIDFAIRGENQVRARQLGQYKARCAAAAHLVKAMLATT